MSAELFAFLLTVAGAGVAVFAVIEFLDLALPATMRLVSDDKYVLAFVLSFVLPIGAYVGRSMIADQEPGLDGMLAAVFVGYTVSKTLHDEFERRGWELKNMRRPGAPAELEEGE